MNKLKEIKEWLKNHKKEITLVSLGTLGFLILDNKIKSTQVFALEELVKTKKELIDVKNAQIDTMDNVIIISQNLLNSKGSK